MTDTLFEQMEGRKGITLIVDDTGKDGKSGY